jgi:hypothetical protein
VYLVGFTVEIYHDARPYKRQTKTELGICWTPIQNRFLLQMLCDSRHNSAEPHLMPVCATGQEVRNWLFTAVHKLTMEQVFFCPSSFSLTCLSAIHHCSTVTYLPSWCVTALTVARRHLWSWNWCFRTWLDTCQTPTVCYAPLHSTPQPRQFRSHSNIKQ